MLSGARTSAAAAGIREPGLAPGVRAGEAAMAAAARALNRTWQFFNAQKSN
jgi:hypothetical protein